MIKYDNNNDGIVKRHQYGQNQNNHNDNDVYQTFRQTLSSLTCQGNVDMASIFLKQRRYILRERHCFMYTLYYNRSAIISILEHMDTSVESSMHREDHEADTSPLPPQPPPPFSPSTIALIPMLREIN